MTKDEALEQPEGKEFFERGKEIAQWADKQAQEPVAWMYNGNLHEFNPSDWATEPVTPRTSPSSWQGLTDDEINELHHKWIMNSGNKDTQYDFARDIEAKLKELNHD